MRKSRISDLGADIAGEVEAVGNKVKTVVARKEHVVRMEGK